MSDEDPPTPDGLEENDEEVLPVIAEASTGEIAPPRPEPPGSAAPRPEGPAAAPARPERPRLVLAREPLYRSLRGYRMRLEPADLARLRELPGSKGQSDEQLGEAFFDGQADRFAQALSGDVPAPAEIRVVVDPYSRQAFLALDRTIRAILSF